jgi:GntR family transcriptional regulator
VNELAGKIKVDFRADEPLYLQIVRQFEDLMRRGELLPGNQLPTVRELATELRINFNTVSPAYRILDEAGLISTQRGRGTFAWERPGEEAIRSLHQKELQELMGEYLDEAGRLGFQQAEIETVFKELVAAWKEQKIATTSLKENARQE